MRADGKAMRLIAHPLDEIEYRIAWRQLDRRACGQEKSFVASVALRSLGNANDRQFLKPKFIERFACGTELTRSAVDQQKIGPRRLGISFAHGVCFLRRLRCGRFYDDCTRRLRNQTLKAPLQHLAHHGMSRRPVRDQCGC